MVGGLLKQFFNEGWFEKEQGSGSVTESRRTDKEKVLRNDHGSGSVSESRGGRIKATDLLRQGAYIYIYIYMHNS